MTVSVTGSRFDHVVDVYKTPFELISRLSEYLVGSLAHDGAVLVVASASHRKACADAVRARGVDVDAMRAASRLVELDAAETLRRISVGGQINHARFDAVIGGLLTHMSSQSRSVRAYGEMVALLWGDGLINAALDLEAWWNEFAGQVPFSLYCSYPHHLFDMGDGADEFAAMCGQHSEVCGLVPITGEHALNGWLTIATRTFEAADTSVRSAREFVNSTLRGWALDNLVRDAELVVSELVTNAVRHAMSRPSVVVSANSVAVRVWVGDADSRQPILTTATDEAASGRGLMIVAALAQRWGHESTRESKAVWAELALARVS